MKIVIFVKQINLWKVVFGKFGMKNVAVETQLQEVDYINQKNYLEMMNVQDNYKSYKHVELPIFC